MFRLIYFAHTVYCCPYDSENVERKEQRGGEKRKMKKRNWRDETKREGSGKETEKVVYSGTRLV